MATMSGNQPAAAAPPTASPTPRYCPGCGSEHGEGDLFCGTCGRPVEPSAVPAPAAARRYGGFWIRVGASLIDLAAFGVPWGIFTAATGIAGTNLALLVGLTIWWLYNALMESSPSQATLGKMALGLRVTDGAGIRIGFGRASGRFFSKFISAMIVYVGFLMVGWTDRHRGLHDMLAGTLVERTRP